MQFGGISKVYYNSSTQRVPKDFTQAAIFDVGLPLQYIEAYFNAVYLRTALVLSLFYCTL